MHPAASIIAFTTLSGAGFGLIAALGLGFGPDRGAAAWLACALAFVLTGGGLIASTRHLARPERAWRAFSQWRSSWLSREAAAAVATLVAFGFYAGAWLLLDARLWGLGWLAAGLAILTAGCTAMIYGALAAVPRWSRAPTPTLFVTFAAAGGLLAAGAASGRGAGPAALALVVAGVAALWWETKARAATLATSGATPEAATALTGLGAVRLLDPPHSAPNYVMREMVCAIGRRRARALRRVALLLGLAAPLALIALGEATGGRLWLAPALALHLTGVAAHRWLFFAEAEHAVGVYYGRR